MWTTLLFSRDYEAANHLAGQDTGADKEKIQRYFTKDTGGQKTLPRNRKSCYVWNIIPAARGGGTP
jgi:hypothetical protein